MHCGIKWQLHLSWNWSKAVGSPYDVPYHWMGGPLRFWHRISGGNCILWDGIPWVLLVGIYVLFWKKFFNCPMRFVMNVWSLTVWNFLRLLIYQPLADMESGAPYNHSSYYLNLPIMVCSQKEQHTTMFSQMSEHHWQCSVCNPAKIFLTTKFTCFLFCNPAHKTESETANRWETPNGKPPVPIIMNGWS